MVVSFPFQVIPASEHGGSEAGNHLKVLTIYGTLPSLYLVWKYADDFDAGIQANAEAGGDNCHRAAVVGSLLGGAQGVPKRWLNGLKVNRSLFSRSTIR